MVRAKDIFARDRAALLLHYASDLDFETDHPSPTQGMRYFNTTDKAEREYIDGAWRFTAGAGTSAVVIHPTVATVSPFKSATTPVFVSSSVVRINRTTDIEDQAIPGAPLRFSDTGMDADWRYAQIISRVVNLNTIDLTIVGVAMTAPLVTYVEIGSQNQIKTVRIQIDDNVVTGDDQEGTVKGSFTQWMVGEGYFVRFVAFANTVTTPLTLQYAKGTVAGNITTAGLAVGTPNTVFSSGIDIDYANQKTQINDRHFLNVDAGSGSKITVIAVLVIKDFVHEEFIPLGPAETPYAILAGGINLTPTVFANMEYLSLTGIGDSQNRDNLSTGRGCPQQVYGPIYTYIVSGISTSPSTVSSVIDRALTQAISGDAVSAGSPITNRARGFYFSGTAFGFYGVGKSSSTNHSTVESIDITLASVTAISSGSSLTAKEYPGSGYSNGRGYAFGGDTTISVSLPPSTAAQLTVIEFYSTAGSLVGTAVSLGSLPLAVTAPIGASWTSGVKIFSGGGLNGSILQTTINKFNSDGLAASVSSVSALTVARAGGSGASGDTKGNFIGGETNTAATTFSSIIEEFNFALETIATRGNVQTTRFGMGATP